MGHVLARAKGGVCSGSNVRRRTAQQMRQTPPPDILRQGRVARGQGEKSLEVVAVDGKRAVHIGLAQGELGVQHQTSGQGRVIQVQRHEGGRPGRRTPLFGRREILLPTHPFG